MLTLCASFPIFFFFHSSKRATSGVMPVIVAVHYYPSWHVIVAVLLFWGFENLSIFLSEVY